MQLTMIRTLCLSFLLFSGSSLAFGQIGHRMICELAYEMLSPNQQTRVDALLEHTEFDQFPPACVWADRLRGQEAYDFARPHHYVNISRGDTEITMEHCPDYGCVLSAIKQHVATLERDSYSADAAKSLKFLSHFVGDLHQPLHVGYDFDRGGNDTGVIFMGEVRNLHGIWDTGMLLQLGFQDYQASIDRLRPRLTEAALNQWQQGEVLDWANESVKIVQQIYAEHEPGKPLDQSYALRHQETLETRLLQASARLAWLLQQLWPDEN
ncbi:S1/P1 nuclease [Alkalimonas collagenimarina]|uniref:S1/P1 nuclease n=1 Tax=Alkalimonas collagenimarina TaxID=400390 RepID=A0ABT9H000_9GAMM|nr:S1/P1 nuclease [Alkalimonas collagenimarina]MDP4536610.1 S1/P1 nuclease [Alkalimonas collagenimarina]